MKMSQEHQIKGEQGKKCSKSMDHADCINIEACTCKVNQLLSEKS